MSVAPIPSAIWQFSPIQVWQWPHSPSTRAEPAARAHLAAVLGYAPRALPLQRDLYNRPQLTGELAHWDCNWSHSGEHMLLALGKGVRLGVDVEQQRSRRQLRPLIRRFFHADEITWLESLDDTACEEAFFRLWCAKEALLKAYGRGLSFGLHKLCFRLTTNNDVYLSACDPALGAVYQWQLQSWQPLPGYHAALAWKVL